MLSLGKFATVREAAYGTAGDIRSRGPRGMLDKFRVYTTSESQERKRGEAGRPTITMIEQ